MHTRQTKPFAYVSFVSEAPVIRDLMAVLYPITEAEYHALFKRRHQDFNLDVHCRHHISTKIDMTCLRLKKMDASPILQIKVSLEVRPVSRDVWG